MLIEKIIGSIDEIEAKGRNIDRVYLTHDELIKPHQKALTEGNAEVKISLPHGENLFCGAVLYMDEKMLIVVDMRSEKVFELHPKTHMEWAKAAFNIGNMHQSAFLYEDCIRVPYDYVLEKMMDALNIEYSIEMRKLDGMRANTSFGGHHGH